MSISNMMLGASFALLSLSCSASASPPGQTAGAAENPPVKLTVNEQSLAKLDFNWENMKVSADGKHVAYVQEGMEMAVCLDGKRVGGSEYYQGLLEEADCIVFSPDGQHLAFIAAHWPTCSVACDGEESRGYEYVWWVKFSADGKHLVYAARGNGKCFIVVDGVEGKEYDGVGNPVVTPHAEKVAYSARTGRVWHVVVNGQERKPYDDIGLYRSPVFTSPLFSPDGKRMAYGAERAGKCFVVVDGVEGPAYDCAFRGAIPFPTFSPDSRRIAYAVQQGKKCFVVVDGVAGPEYDLENEVFVPRPKFSPDSRHVAYAAQRGKKTVVVTDQLAGPECDGVVNTEAFSSPAFSADSQHVVYLAGNNGKWSVVMDGVEKTESDMISDAAVSPDGKRLAYATSRVVDKTVRYVVVLDGKEGKQYYWMGRLVFSPDSKHLAYLAKAISGKVIIVVDGIEAGNYDDQCRESVLAFDGNKRLSTILIREGELFRVSVDIVDPTQKLDLSTPQSAYLSFKDAVSKRDWKRAERCLATDLREKLKDSIADRSFFDQYVVSGFATKTLELLPVRCSTEEGIAGLARLDPGRRDGPPGGLPERFEDQVGSGGGECPWVAICGFVRETDGYKVTVRAQMLKKKEDFANWYAIAISKGDRGKAKEVEGKPVEPPPKPGREEPAGPPLPSPSR